MSSETKSPPLSDPELASLLSLLDDPDERIALAVTERLTQKGSAALEPLIGFSAETHSGLGRDRAEALIQTLSVGVLTRDFEDFARELRNRPATSRYGQNSPFDLEPLERGAILIARFGNPRLDPKDIRFQLNTLSAMLRDQIAVIRDPYDLLTELNTFFFIDQNFKGNQRSFLEPENSYIDRVLDRRVGIPITLAIIYLLVVSRLRLPFSGASTPGHFLIRYDGTPEPVFIDAFNGGVLLRKRDIQRFLEASGLPFNESFVQPTQPRAILLRMMRNLIIAFRELHDKPSEAAFRSFMKIIAPDASPDLPMDDA